MCFANSLYCKGEIISCHQVVQLHKQIIQDLLSIFPEDTKTCMNLHHNTPTYESEHLDFVQLPPDGLGIMALDRTNQPSKCDDKSTVQFATSLWYCDCDRITWRSYQK